MQKYLMTLSVPCGYVQLKLGLKESTKIMLSVLEVNEARGKRKFIRAICKDDELATANVKGLHGVSHGKILDISSAAISIHFDKFETMPPKTVVRDMQFNLRGQLVLTDVIYVGQRDGNVYIFLFDISKMNPDYKLTIHRFIKHTLQRYIDTLVI
jgi:hypothetical protein